MTPERWAEVDRVWHAVLARPDAERATAVAELCAGDEGLRAEVESLLAHLVHASAAGFGAVPGVATAGASLIGCRLGPYAVQELLGAGGMGEVYRAHDSTLGRDVALKILPDHWMDDLERRGRFEREARVLASLNHPNIGAIYGVHETGASSGLPAKALVLELVEGETLADRIVHQRLPGRGLAVDDVRAIATQVLDALEAAHVHGIVHRDLKPGNIKVTPEGRVKVLDFGLARELGGAETGAAVRLSPTTTLAGTRGGVVLGTAAYMSPEQARGKPADRRTDVWAFGCVLYEMLTGRPVFTGEAVGDVLANVIKTDPDWRVLPTDIPAAMRSCLQRCLQKDPRQRLHDVADVRLVMEGAFSGPIDEIGNARTRPSGRLAYAGWIAAALIAIAAAVVSSSRWSAELPETRLEIVTPPTRDPASFAISPDGRRIVFAAGPGELATSRGEPLSLRQLDSSAARALTGTVGGTMPFWSPDGQSIGFFADGLLKRIDLSDGFVRTLARAPQARRGAWSTEGTILFSTGSAGPLSKVPAGGGPVQQATTLLQGQTNHRWPQFLPDGRRFLLFALGSRDVRGVYVASIDSAAVRRVSDRESAYTFMPPAHLLFAKQGALWARKLSGDDTIAQGEFVPVAPKVLVVIDALGLGAFSTSSAGLIAYRASAGETQLVWLDRGGRVVARLGEPDDNQLSVGPLSADGRTAAVSRTVDGNGDVWLADTERGVFRRLTTDPGNDFLPVLSPDGSRVAYVTDGKDDVHQVHERRSDGTGDAMLLFESPENKLTADWSSDGRYVLYISQASDGNFDLWALPLFGDRKPLAIARTPFREISGRFSPDARWVAYSSDEAGKPEIYIQRFPEAGPKVQVSVGGGSFPRWRRDGRELFYLAPDSRLMSVSVRQGNRLDIGPPRPLFTLSTTSRYEPSPDGQRFLVTAVVSEASPISVILNWKPPAR